MSRPIGMTTGKVQIYRLADFLEAIPEDLRQVVRSSAGL